MNQPVLIELQLVTLTEYKNIGIYELTINSFDMWSFFYFYLFYFGRKYHDYLSRTNLSNSA